MSELKTERIQVLLSPSQLQAIDDWSFRNRIRSRGEAIRRLVEIGLEASSGEAAKKPRRK